MKASEIVSQLQDLILEHGDHDCVIDEDGYCDYSVETIKLVPSKEEARKTISSYYEESLHFHESPVYRFE